MKRSILFSGIMIFILLLISCDNSTSVKESSICDDIEGQYIVVFHEYWQEKHTSEVAEEVQEFTDQFLNDYDIPPDFVIARFELVLRGFAAHMDEAKAELILKDSRVDYVDQNRCAQVMSQLNLTIQEEVNGKS